MSPPRRRAQAPKETPRTERRYQVGILLGPKRAAILQRLVDSELYGSSPTTAATILLNKALELTLLDGTLDAISPPGQEK
jgi:hypothetical protein